MIWDLFVCIILGWFLIRIDRLEQQKAPTNEGRGRSED